MSWAKSAVTEPVLTIWSAMVMLMVGQLFEVEGGELVVGYDCVRVWAPDIFGWRLYIQT